MSGKTKSPNLFGYEENALRIRERYHQPWNEDSLSEEAPESHYRTVYLYEEEFMTENPIKPFLIQNPVDKRSGKYSANMKGSGSIGFSKDILSKMKRTSVGI
ncbi:hypothetical protein CU098_010528 [Rhizopus stolonifer]|uniref:Uncharacterized protein n=1 Tax=Rhizopus stolonifer TaxID=4846 RepID=A0A367KBD9_RHIST|nr:hypothetical protein CU098_010528 [Rhizopus stolonifer]